MTVTVGNVDAVRGLLAPSLGVLFLCCGICVGGDMNNNEKFRSFKSKENIHKKEVGPYRGFGY